MYYKLYKFDKKFISEINYFPFNFTGIIEYPDGTKEWFFEGKIHRIGGPAITHPDGTKSWFINGKEVSEREHKLYVDIMKLKGLL